MSKPNTIAIDLAKSSFHVVAQNPVGEIIVDRAMSVNQRKKFLVRQPASTGAMEACGSAHYWCWTAEEQGHQVILLPAFHVAPFRQGHKTDQTDAFAVLAAAQRAERKEAVKKTPEQLELQALLKIRDSYVDQKRRLSNAIRGHLFEFGIRIPKGYKQLREHLYAELEDAENGVPDRLRALLHRLYTSFSHASEHVAELDRELVQVTKHCEPCRRLQSLEGIGPVNAIALYTRIGDGSAFKNGREASALHGVTPQQHSTGGVANIGHIRKRHVDKQLRANLIQGALAAINIRKKATKSVSAKLRWLDQLIERRGARVAAVALVNKNIRTAWAMLSRNEEYVPV
jgi:transposase